MSKFKRIFAFALAAALAVTTLAGCGSDDAGGTSGTAGGDTTGSSTGTGDEAVIRLVVPGISEKATIDPISGLTSSGIEEFETFLNEKIEGAQIQLISIPWDGWIQKIEVMATSGEMDVGFFTNQVAVPDWYQDLTPFLENDPDVNFDTLADYFVEPAVHYTEYKSFNYPEATGNIYGLPMTMACNLFVYDRQLFEEWGIEEPDENTTMDELVAMAEAMTGTNPVTGKQNYGGYLVSMWQEWISITYDAVKQYKGTDMILADLDMDEYVEYMPGSQELLNYFTALEKIIDSSPEGIATGNGAEKFWTEDNDIAINFDTNSHTGTMLKYIFADYTEVTDRFVPLVIPTGNDGRQGFPEFFRFSVAQQANDADAAWEVVKQLTTNPEIVDFYLLNYATDKLPAIKNVDSLEFMQYELNQRRHQYQTETVFLTDDYWFWRVPMQDVVNMMIAKEISPEQARDELYEGVNDWINNTRLQLGQ